MELDGTFMIKRHLYILILSLIFFLGCTPKSTQNENNTPKISILQQITKDKEIKVAVLNNSIDYFTYKGTPMGFHYELVKDYAEHLGVNLNLSVVQDYATAFKMLETGECHLFAASVNITGSRKKKMLFCKPFLRSNPVLVQNKNSSKQYIEDWLDYDSIRIAISTHSSNKRIIQNIEESLGLYIHTDFYSGVDQEELIDLVAEDSIASTLADKLIAKVATTYYPNLDISIDAGLPHNMAWAIDLKATELQQSINEWIDNYKKSKRYRTLYTKYFRNPKSIERNKKGNIASAKYLSPYDKHIKKEAKVLGWDWRLLAALIYTESRFDPSQVSWAGAFGLMQLMPVTAKNFGASRNSSAQEQLIAGRKYIQYLEEKFAKDMIDREDLQYFVLAAYNSGSGHIIDARHLAEKEGRDRDKWGEVYPYILRLNHPKYYNDEVVKHGYFKGKETVEHVSRIVDLYENYKNLFPED